MSYRLLIDGCTGACVKKAQDDIRPAYGITALLASTLSTRFGNEARRHQTGGVEASTRWMRRSCSQGRESKTRVKSIELAPRGEKLLATVNASRRDQTDLGGTVNRENYQSLCARP